MEIIEGRAEIESLDRFLSEVRRISDETAATVQFFNADYVAGERHLRRATELAHRAVDRGETIAREPAVELLLYAAGRRQINRALEMGVAEGSMAVVGVVDGGEIGDETRAVDRIRTLPVTIEPVRWGDRETLTEFFEIGEKELQIVDDDLESVVLERVALLAVEK